MSDLFKLLFITILHCALLTSPTLMAQETPLAENASDTEAPKPTLNELMTRFAEIEASYLPFHIDFSELQNTTIGPSLAETTIGETGPNPAKYSAQRGHKDSKVWMLEFTSENLVVPQTVRFVHSASELHRKDTSPGNTFDKFDDDDETEPPLRPLEGVFPLTFHTMSPVLLSHYFAEAPTQFALQWHDHLAQVTCRYYPANGQSVTVELWLDPDFAWHPVFMRRYPHRTRDLFPDEWKVTEFRLLDKVVRVSAGEFVAPIRRRLVPGHQTIAFFRCRYQILKAVYEDRVPEAVFSTETPIGGSPISDLEPIGGKQVLVTSYQQAEKQAVLLFPAEVSGEEADQAVESTEVNEIPESISTQIIPLELELAELRTKLGINHPKVVSLEKKLAAMQNKAKQETRETPLVPSVNNEQLKIFNLLNSNAIEAADILTVLYDGPSVRITVDQRTNAVIVRADESRLSEIEAVLLRLDEQPNSGGAKSSTGKIQASGFYLREDSAANVGSGTGVPIAEYRRQLDALEQPVLQLAEQVRTADTKHGKDHPDSAKLRADLRAAVQQTFAARQKIQRAELAEFTRRLQHMQQSIDARDRIADKVIDRRLEELLDPNIAWTQLSTPLVQSESTSPIQPPEPKIISEVSEEKQTVSIERRKKLSDMLASLQGEWKCEVFNIEGESVIRPGDLPILKIEGSVASTSLKILDVDDYPSSKEPEVHVLDATWVLELNGADTPQHVDLLFDPNGEKRQQYGIIDCSDDRLRICIASEEPESETSRPGIFASGSTVIYVEARKQDARLSAAPGLSEKPDVTFTPAPPSEISVADESLNADADVAAESERAAAVLVDLKPYYSAFAKDFEKATRFPWKWVPRGSQTFANVPLDIGGRICLWGERNANVNGQVFPEKVEGIAIDREFETLFVYHCTFFESPPGTPVYELIFHYEDNTSTSDTIRYLDDVRDWYCNASEKQIGPTGKRSALVWHGASIIENGADPGGIQSLRFCLTAIENPHPDRKVKAVDLVSSKNQSAGCILAMTLGKETLMRRASPE